MTTPLEIALAYVARAWNPVPVAFRDKKPTAGNGWQHLRINAENAAQYFNGVRRNIGVQLGAASGNLRDVDLDCPEAIAAAPYLLPPTGAIFGRASARNSHWLYVADDFAEAIDVATLNFDDPAPHLDQKERLCEFRVGGGAKGAQTVFPGSTHKEGEAITWEVAGEPSRVDGARLLRCVGRVASAALLARHWPNHGKRHDTRLAIGGVLAHAGWSEQDAKLFAEAIAHAVGDEDVADFKKAIGTSFAGLGAGAPITGIPKFADIFGDAVTRAIKDWLRLETAEYDAPRAMLDAKPRRVAVTDGVEHDAETGEILAKADAAPPSGCAGQLGILSSAQFVAGFTPPDYFIDGVCQRGFLYSLTAATGAGKTAIALAIAAMAGRGGGALGGREVQGGQVLFLAGENPDDIRMRWIAMAHHFGFDIDAICVRFRPVAFDIGKSLPDLRAEAEAAGGFTLVIADTSAAFFQGDDENSNTQLGAYARTQLRKLTDLPGRPCVIVPAHPVKGATSDNLLPRGGGAFIAEMDGNLTAVRSAAVVKMHWAGKHRGPDFEALRFALENVTAPRLVDSRGRQIPSVIARCLDEREAGNIVAAERRDEDVLLELMLEHENAAIAALANFAGWTTGDDATPHKSKVARILQSFAAERPPLAKKLRGHWKLTAAGHEEAARVRDERKKAEQNAAKFSRLGAGE
ncbi:AAA family ATPase [Methylocystis sp. L43]|uniref:AAA family ATPase n=1 Tax=unclassified Methylocystis TaxID=2625913 RepID=UPI0018C2D4C5|nr:MULTISPECIES: AAA family ATPase [unclassified Methylocystis]MBG0797560.1 AAA family ATPase [Methylocystis sp. L43]MBG0805164.1 AAA family ATPase [Methylocystis sp. H15]